VIQRYAVINRRRFLYAAGAAAALPLAAQRRREAESNSPLPESITSLPSLAAQAKPITNDERRQRLERARQLLTQAKLDAMFVSWGTSLVYFTGIRWQGGERLFGMVLPGKGEPFFVAPAFEEDRAREQIARGPFSGSADVRTWQEDESPYQRVAQGLRDRGIAAGTLGVEETTKFVFADGIAHAAPQLKIVSATPVTAGCRQIKSAHEIELMRLASRATHMAYEAAWKALKPGMTQNDFGALVSAAHRQLGFDGGASVNVGEYSALPHGSATPQTIREGTILLIDGGCSVGGYQSDLSRTFVLGKPTDKMRRVFDIVHQAQATALKTARPGVECQAVDAAARKVITDAGYGPDYRYFTHRVGHGMGMDGHEWPYLVRGNSLPLAANMTFSDEPGVYIRGEFGVRLEDDMLITENGAELLTPPSPSLEQPMAKISG